MSDPCAPAPDDPAGQEPASAAQTPGLAVQEPASAAQESDSAALASDTEAREPVPPPVTTPTGTPRQRIVRNGRRRASLTPAPGSDPDPLEPDFADPDAPTPENTGPNDARMRQDVPPHY